MSGKQRAQAPDETGGLSLPLLKALHILTRDGKLNADARRKLKQVQHLFQLIKPALDELSANGAAPLIADMGAGKSYLGFILYDLYLRQLDRGALWSIEARSDLVARAEALARESGFSRMHFVAGAIGETRLALPEASRVGLVTALHACDTATDDAIRFALAHDARFIALVPCCQAELARLLEDVKPRGITELWRRPMHRREFASNLTNVIRALYLEACGYKVRVTEFTGFEHTLKNELILGERIQRANGMAERALKDLLAEIPVRPGLLAGDPRFTISA
ncbi:MAG TPA: SAM-dependent methyltransferase [Micropepsaceae bacterium]|nr:SAM-dependent methyltransferase [Micropepsaceae bacterium]